MSAPAATGGLTAALTSFDTAARCLELTIGAVRMHLLDAAAVSDRVATALAGGSRQRPLAVGSVNLDHVFHFGVHRAPLTPSGSAVRWLMLIDGSPVARRARGCTGEAWPRLTGADLLPDLLTMAARTGARVGFLGGTASSTATLREAARRGRPGLQVAGVWTPSRGVIDDPVRSADLARVIADAGVDLLVVGLGKPRQEEWIARHGAATGAAVLTAFGAAAGFLSGSAPRAPRWMRTAGIEWLYRLGREPRRLWRRYLVQGPVALAALLRSPATLDYVLLPGGDPPR